MPFTLGMYLGLMHCDNCPLATLPSDYFLGCYCRVKCNILGWICLQTMENSTLFDPCFHEGYQRTINLSDLFKNPCTSDKKKQFPFSQLFIQGEGDYQKCRTNIQKLFNKTSCPHSSCSFNGIYLPPLQGDFGVSLHILQLSVTQNITTIETQVMLRVHSPYARSGNHWHFDYASTKAVLHLLWRQHL